MAPINLPDGSEVSEVILPDGSTASEVIAPDGSTVVSPIPGSLVTQFDASQETGVADGDQIQTLTDLVGSTDVTGGATYLDNQQNGLPVIDFNGNEVFTRTASNTTTITQPFSIITVLTRFNKNSNTFFVTREASGDSLFRHGYSDSSIQYETRADDPVGGGDAAAPVIVTSVFDGASSKIRENGTETGSGDAGNNDLESLTIGGINGGGQLDGAIGEIRIYDSNIESTGDLSSEESNLSDKWGIAI